MDYNDVLKLFTEKVRRAKAQLGLNVTMVIKENNKCLYKYIKKKRRVRRISIHYWMRTKNKENYEVFKAFFALVFNSKTCCSGDTLSPELEDRDRE